MADNVSNQIKNLDQWIKNADNSLKHLLDTYTELNQKASNRSTRSFLGTETSKIKKDVTDAQANIKTLSEEIRKLMQTARNPKEIEALSKALKDLARSSTSFGSILTTINRSKQVSQSLTNRITQSTYWGMGALSRLNIASAYNNGASAANNFSRSAKNAKSSIESMLPTLRRLASAFGVAFSVQGLVNFGRKLVETRGEFELQQVAMRSILQNKQLADEIWDKTMQAALQSPFTAMQLTKYTKQLAAYRIETDKLFDTTKRLADVSAGLGVDMQRLILAYGQVKAANYLRASEIRQFTEAGVNILGELSTYLSKTRGEMISTAQVMDMVQKRMVTFEDVEAIFKRMTDEGGIFYNMQYVQSQTVKGQINKLHDAYDQMLNSIGKGNEGVLKDVVAALNNIVQNWRYWAAAIKSIAFGTIIASLTKLGVTLTGVNVAGIAAGKGMTKLAGGVKALGVALKGNWLTLVIGTVVSLAAELYNLNKRMEAVNAEIDEQNLNLFETKERLEGYQDAIKRNNKALEGSTGNEEKLKKKREENAEILSKLKNDYPQLVEGMEMQKNGVIDLTDALKKENEELERQITLNTLMKQSSIFDENLTEDAQDLSKAYINQQQQIIAARAQARSLMVQLKQRGAEGSNQYDILKQISEINPDDLQKAYDRLIELRHLLYNDIFTSYGKQPAAGTYQPLVDYYRNYLRGISDVSGSEKKLGDEFNKLGEYVGYELEKGLEEAYKEEIEKSGLSTLQWYALNVNKVQKDVNDGVVDIYRFLRESLEKNGQAQGPGMQAFWNNIVKTNYIDPYFKAWKVGMEEVEAGGWRFPMALPTEGGMPNIFAAPKKGGGTSGNIITDDDGSKAKKNASRLISLIREMRAEYDKLSKSAYGYAKSEATVRESYKQSVKEILGKAGITDYDFTTNAGMIAALEKVKEYATKLGPEAAAEVQKYIDQLETEITINAQVRIREDFGRQMEEAFGDYQLTLDLEKLQLPSGLLKDMFDIDDTDLAAMRQKLEDLSKDLTDENGVMTDDNLKLYEQWLKKLDDEERKLQQQRLKDYSKYLEYQLSDRAKLEMEYVRKVAEVQSEIAYDDTTRQRILDGLRKEYEKNIAKQDWEDFKGSEIYVEMMEDLTKQGTAALEEMRKKLIEVRDNAENLSPRALKEVINALEKIDETIYGRMTPFQAVRELRKQARGAMNENGVLDISEAFERDANAKKEYEEHRKLHEQLEQEIADKQKLKDISEQLGDVRYEEVEDLRKRQKSAQQNLKDEQEHLKLLGIRTKENEIEYDNTLRNINIYSGLSDQYQKQIDLLTQYQSISKKLANSEFKDKSLKDLLSMSKEELDAMGLSEEEMKNIGEILKYWKLMRQAEIKALEEVKNYLSIIQSIGKNTADMLHTLGVEQNPLSDYWEQATDAAFSYVQETIEAIKQFKEAKIQAEAIAGAGEDLMTGNYIKLALRLLGVLLQVVNQIGLFRGARIDNEIMEEQEYIDELSMAYDRLEKAIAKTVTTSDYLNTYNKQIQNTYQQIAATRAQLAAAQSRKNVDQSEVDGYRSALYELNDQLEDLQNQMQETFGGIGGRGNYRSWAEEFVSEWRSAFLETGDGLDALEDHFNEFLQSWFEKQATMRIAAKMLDPLMSMIDQSVDDGLLTRMELDRIKERASEIFPQLNEQLREFYETMGFGDAYGSLSGLAQAISGMTEEQADILAAYWNSVRMHTASIDINVAAIANALGVGAGSPESNPMLQQIRKVARDTENIYSLLGSVVKANHPQGGNGIRIFMD